MTLDAAQVFTILAEVLRQGGLAAFLTLSLYVNWRLYKAKDALYDRLIESESKRADSAEDNVTAIVTEMTQIRMVMSELKELEGAEEVEELPESPDIPALPASTDEGGSDS
jgi:hypothetical protein